MWATWCDVYIVYIPKQMYTALLCFALLWLNYSFFLLIYGIRGLNNVRNFMVCALDYIAQRNDMLVAEYPNTSVVFVWYVFTNIATLFEMITVCMCMAM